MHIDIHEEGIYPGSGGIYDIGETAQRGAK
ncbi:hypothetical protein OCC_13745 [Thermococcus litoralis DSM 5473]|uniref:Uncharacterized protein n=1 Tax=Thermococcus litoralis (strain ATCC 51850 / DSM 5473 / JCM 8560 / NS-C) TaxID=523849 RepID=S5ZAZ5_THELN|nr:hypothetical protein OCC_13745 [Thermococcus litoralis DSM 5473]